MRFLSLSLLVLALPFSARGGVVLSDDFRSFDTNVWTQAAGTFPASLGYPQLLLPNTYQGRSSLQMVSMLDDNQIRGIETRQAFAAQSMRLDVDFLALPNTIDGSLQVWLLSSQDPANNFVVQVFGADHGARRFASTAWDVTPTLWDGYRTSPDGIWDYDTWLTLRIVATPDHLQAALLRDQTTLWTTDI